MDVIVPPIMTPARSGRARYLARVHEKTTPASAAGQRGVHRWPATAAAATAGKGGYRVIFLFSEEGSAAPEVYLRRVCPPERTIVGSKEGRTE